MRVLRQYFVFFICALVLAGLGFALYWQWFSDKKVPTTNLNPVLHRDGSSVFEPVLPTTEISLPRDFHFHPQFQHENWHYLATLHDQHGQQYTVQWNYFRIATDERVTYGWNSPQLYIASVVVTDSEQAYQDLRLARGGIGQGGMISEPFQIWLDNWKWVGDGMSPFPGKLDVTTEQFALNLQTKPNGPFVLNGEQGYQVKHQDGVLAAYSVSAPFLDVMGTLDLNGQPIAVHGQAWLQKEWGSGLLVDEHNGWDWFALHLENGNALSVSQYRDDNGAPFRFGTLTFANGKTVTLDSNQITLKPLTQTTLANGRTVPLQWRISVPAYDIQLITQVNQRNMWLPFMLPYWEGPIHTIGAQKAKGFMQLTGY
ncbi:lipocalin-like domain-containing protein [Vibrio agarilyticus]|uniref:lipocalin-like domain-containing protein n=1 Tax=Vibrio agarilyticus TaxID=2726741 RepID=UPI0031B60B79